MKENKRNEQLQSEAAKRKRAEEALRLSEERFSKAFTANPCPMSIRTLADKRHIDVNESYLQITGYRREEIIGRTSRELNCWADSREERARIRQELLGQRAVHNQEVKFQTKSGEVRTGMFSAELIDVNGEQCILSVVDDITGRKQLEEMLETERQRLISLLEELPAFVCLQAPDYSIRYANRYFREQFGEPGERPCYEIHYGRRKPCAECPTFRVFDTKCPQEWEATYVNGRTYQIYDYPYTDVDGSPLVLVLGIDITGRKQAEELLRTEKKRLSKIINASPSLVSIHAFTDGRFLDVNDSFLRAAGYRREEVIGRKADDLNIWVDPMDFVRMKNMIIKQKELRNLEISFRLKSGEMRLHLVSAEKIEFGDEPYLLVILNDITERKFFEKEMARLDRLHLVGETAAGIGHEIRNPMTTVRGFLQILSSKEECMQYKGYFDLMIEELDRANSIIKEFLSLAKNKTVDLKMQNLNSIVEALFPLIRADALQNDKSVIAELEDIPDLPLDQEEIRQLILNLVRNGLEAMPCGGNLTIKTFLDGREVVLAVQDQGSGIRPEVLEKLGTPFFTTKDHGTGLGLAVCYSIAARHNGAIKVNTGPDGTTFLVRFKRKVLPGGTKPDFTLDDLL